VSVVIVLTLAILAFFHRPTSPKSNRLQAPAIPSKSIAVLPFENLSEEKGNEYFAEGVQDEILARLAKVADLKVVSRTSTQHYKSSPDNLPQIAKQLGVANILEGTVQKSGTQVRVNVQLINALTDAHLWAEIYDRKLTDIFKVESDIAKTIAETLQARLTDSEVHALATRPTENSEAHQLYLKGRYFWNKTTAEDIKKAIDYFNRAIGVDPNYALAYVGLADAYLLLPFITGGLPQDCYPKAKAAAQKALEIDATLGEAHIALGEALRVYDFDYAQASTEFRRGLQLNPNYANGHWRHSWLLAALGRFDEAFAEMKRAAELDPLSLIINTDLGYLYAVTGRYDQAIAQLRRTLEIHPNFYYAHGTLGQAFEFNGSLDAALTEYRKTRELTDDPFVLAELAHVYAVSGNKTEARKFLNEMNEVAKHRYVEAYAFAIVYLALGEKEEALRWLEKSYQDHAGADLAFIRIDPLLAPLRGDPRFEKLANEIVPPELK
jgi:TolB-like protein/Flp pilus assembly protein TadD